MKLIGTCDILEPKNYGYVYTPCVRKAYYKCVLHDEKYCVIHEIHHKECKQGDDTK